MICQFSLKGRIHILNTSSWCIMAFGQWSPFSPVKIIIVASDSGLEGCLKLNVHLLVSHHSQWESSLTTCSALPLSAWPMTHFPAPVLLPQLWLSHMICALMNSGSLYSIVPIKICVSESSFCISQGGILPSSQQLQAREWPCPYIDTASICLPLSFLDSLGFSKTLDNV